jgi:hypothetical protein
VWFGLLTLLALAVPLRADNVQTLPVAPGSQVTIKVTSPTLGVPHFGFAPLHVTIENGAARERTWSATFQVGARQWFPGLASTTRTFTVPAGQTRAVWVFVPVAEPSTDAGTVVGPGPGPAGQFDGSLLGGITGGARRSPSGGLPAPLITRTPSGTKVSTFFGHASGTFFREQEINAVSGAVTTTYVMPAGRPAQRSDVRPPPPHGAEVTFAIDQTNGDIRRTTRTLADRSAPPKIFIVTVPPAGSGTEATLVSSNAGTGAPMVVGGANSLSAMAVEFAGPGVTDTGRLEFSSPPNLQMRPFAVTGSLEPAVRSQLAAVVRGTPNLSAVELAQLPADWRLWSSFAAVVMTTDEFASLDAGRRAALRGWVGLGGRLWLSPAAAGPEEVERFGAGQITTLAEPIAAEAAAGFDPRTSHFWVTKLEIYGATPGLPNASDLVLEKTPIGEAVQEHPANNTWLAVFLVAFAIVVGPVNLFVFAPAAKRHRLFLTTPLLALAGALVLGATILLQDGFGGDGARRALVVLLPGENLAAVFQEQAAVTGFLTQRTFAAADDMQLAVIRLDSPAGFQSLGRRPVERPAELVRADGGANGDWFRSRGRQAHLVQRLVPTRGRVERAGTAPDGAPIVQSSLGTTLREFVCVDAAGKSWIAAELPPGKRVTLTEATRPAGPLAAGGSRRFGAIIEAATPKMPDHWHAHGGETELAPVATLGSVRWQEGDVLFAGVLEPGQPAMKREAGR